jgi:ATP phosphoribosyltransferase regulatory subunit HisZ
MRHPGSSNEFGVVVEFTHAVRRREELFDQFATLMQNFGYDRVDFSITHDPDPWRSVTSVLA